MNDYLIKNLRISIIKEILISIIFFSVFLYVFNPFEEYYEGIVFIVFPIYLLLKQKKIILNLIIESENIKIHSYNILTGEKELNLDLNEIVELDFYNGFIIKYRKLDRKKTEVFEINAEPWNNIYEQVKLLKLSFQEFKKKEI